MARTRSKKSFDPAYNHHEPAVSLKFEQALKKIGEPTPLGSRLQRVWGCTARHFRLDKWRLKYLTGYALEHTLHQNKATGIFYYEDVAVELGMPRHVIEVWLPPSYFGSNGQDVSFDMAINTNKTNLDVWEESWNKWRFEFIGTESVSRETIELANKGLIPEGTNKEVLSSVGAKLVDVLGPFPRQGEYRYFYTIEDEEGEYKDPDMSDIDFLRESYRLAYETPVVNEDLCKIIENKDEQLHNKLFDPDEIHKAADAALASRRRIIFDPVTAEIK
jgi:hypothetical protein